MICEQCQNRLSCDLYALSHHSGNIGQGHYPDPYTRNTYPIGRIKRVEARDSIT